jgi:hypothetical protein
MSNAPEKLKSPFVPHLNDIQLVAYQDGEMSRGELDLARAHVEGCWICRSRLGTVQENIDRFLEARKSHLPAASAFAENRVEQFRQRLTRHSAETEGDGISVAARVRDRLITGARGFAVTIAQHRKAAIASALAACLLVVMFTDVLNTRVSADTVLARSENYEVAHHPAKGQVSRISVRVERIDRRSGTARQLGTITTVHDSETPVTYWQAQSLAGSLEKTTANDATQIAGSMLRAVLPDDNENAPLIEYLDHERWLPDFSVEGFRRLVGSRGTTEASVKRAGEIFELDYPFISGHSSGITEARLQVNAQDYAPTSISFVISAEHAAQEYRFTRTSMANEPRSMELAHLIAPPGTSEVSIGHSVPGNTAAVAPLHRPVPLTYANSRATLAEIAAAEALHKVDACLGEEVYLFPMSDGSLLVQGLVDSSVRRDAIRQSLKTVAGPLRVEIFVPRELKNGSELYSPPDRFEGVEANENTGASSVPTTLADLSSSSMPLHDRIYTHLSRSGIASGETEKQVAIFSNEIVTHARQTFLHAWALRKLDREFSPERMSGLPASALKEVQNIREDHQHWIANLAQRQSEMLSTIAETPLAAGMSEGDLEQMDSETLMRLAREQNDLVRSLFTTSRERPEASTSLSHLMMVLRRMGG